MSRNRFLLASLLLTAAAFAVTAALFPRLPAQMPIHWGVSGEADNFAPKQLGAFLLPIMMVGWLLLSRLLPWLSPKRFELEPFWSTYEYLVFIILLWMGYTQGTVLWGSLAKVGVGKAIIAGVFLLFALLGNVLGKVRPNFWIGVRTPWTIANEQVWTETHRFAARLYFVIGLLGFVAILAGVPMVWCFLLLIVGLFVPVLYSLVRYKQLVDGGRHLVLIVSMVLVAAVVLVGIGSSLPYADLRAIAPPPDLVRSAQAMITSLQQHHPDAAVRDFDDGMRQALPPQQLQGLWDSLISTNGAFHGTRGVRAERDAGYRAVHVTCEFGSSWVDFTVVFDHRGRISGLWQGPPRPQGWH